MGRLVGDVDAFEHDLAAALIDQADDGTKCRGFAGAVARPSSATTSPRADLEADVEQDVRRSVKAIETRNLEFHVLGFRVLASCGDPDG